MTPPNRLEQIAEFQDAIQSEEGLERLRAMQYLQAMNNQGLMGLPQVTQQPVVQRSNGGNMFESLGHTIDNTGEVNIRDRENLTTEDLSAATYIAKRGGSANEELISQAIIGIFNQINPELVDSFFESEQEEIDLERSDARKEMFENIKGTATKGLKSILPFIGRQYGGEVGTGGLLGLTDDGVQIFDDTTQGIENRAQYGGTLQSWNEAGLTGTSPEYSTAPITPTESFQSMSDVTPLDPVATGMPASLMEMPSVQARGGVYNASEFRDAGVDLATPAGIPETIIQQGQAQVGSMYRDPATGKIPYSLYQPQPVNTYAQGYDLGGMDYFTANQLALNSGADRFMYGGKYAAVDPGLLSNYKDNMDAGFSEETAYGMIKPWGANVERDKIREATIGMPMNTHTGSAAPRSAEETRLIAEGFTRDHSGRLTIPGTPRVEKFRQLQESGIDMSNPYTRMLHGFKHGGSLADTAEGLASLGRYGDNILVHMNPEELEGLASLGRITYNPVTGLPEAFSLGKIFSNITKPIRKVFKSKAFKALAPLALTIAAPYIATAVAPGLFGSSVAGMSALQMGAATGLGSLAGNVLAGAKPGDAFKQALISGALSGGLQGVQTGNWLKGAGAATKTSQLGTLNQLSPGAKNINVGLREVGGGTVGGNPLFKAQQAMLPSASTGTEVIGANILSPGSVPGYTGPGLQATEMMNITPNAVQNVTSNVVPEFSNIQYISDVPPAPVAEKSGFFGRGDLTGRGISADRISQSGTMLEKLKGIPSQIAQDYGNLTGAAKIVGMDLMQPDWDQVYADEKAMENQLAEMGYTIDTGFGGQRVIRDPSGTVLPRNLSVQDILNRALGLQPRTRLADRIDFEPTATAAQGGLVSLAHGGEFSGKVEGDGHGMEDNVFMPIKESGQQIGTLAVSPSEYVVDAYTMSALGNGNPDEGAKVMDAVIKGVRKKAYGTTEQPNEISWLQALQPMMAGV